MATIYGKASDLFETLNQAIKSGEPMINLGPQLMETGLALIAQALTLSERAIGTLERCDQMLTRLERVSDVGEELMATQHKVALLTQRKLELEIAELEERTQPR